MNMPIAPSTPSTSSTPATPATDAPAEIVESQAFTVDALARACGVAPEWVRTRVEAGVFFGHGAAGSWHFDSVTLVRARRILHLETVFESDPQLAALTTDLIEEVARLKRQLRAFGVTVP